MDSWYRPGRKTRNPLPNEVTLQQWELGVLLLPKWYPRIIIWGRAVCANKHWPLTSDTLKAFDRANTPISENVVPFKNLWFRSLESIFGFLIARVVSPAQNRYKNRRSITLTFCFGKWGVKSRWLTSFNLTVLGELSLVIVLSIVTVMIVIDIIVMMIRSVGWDSCSIIDKLITSLS